MTPRTVGLWASAALAVAVAGTLTFVWARAPGPRSAESRIAADVQTPTAEELGAAPPPTLSAQPRDVLQASRGATIELVDETGRVAQTLSYERLEPLEGGRFRVDEPRALIFTRDGRTIAVRARTMQFLQRRIGREPESGWFRGEVAAELFEREPTPTAEGGWRETPSARLRTEEIAFDAASGEIRMDGDVAIDAPTSGVAFRGRGASILISEADRRLLYLRIERSEGLTFGEPARADAAPPAADAEYEPTPGEPGPPPRTDLYRAQFDGPVRLASGGLTVSGEILEAWVRLVGGSLPPDAVLPVFAGTDAPRAARDDVDPGATPGAGRDAGPREPVVLTWEGALELRPLPSAPTELAHDDVFIRLSAPGAGQVRAVETSANVEATAVSLDYGLRSRLLSLTGAGARTLSVVARDRGEIVGPRLEADLASGVASIPGAGVLRAVGAGRNLDDRDETGEPAPREIEWRERAEARFEPAGGSLALREASFEGAVRAREAGAEISADALRAAFAGADASADEIALSRVVAEGSATASTTDGGRIAADRLDLALAPHDATGRWLPSVATATGSVRAARGAETLTAQLVEATFTPTPDGEARVTTFEASVGVVARLGDAAQPTEIRAERLRARPEDQVAELAGGASLRRGGGTIDGESMRLEGQPRRLSVFGPGSASYVRQGADALLDYDHVRATWSGAMTHDDSAGRTEIGGDVVLSAEQGDLRRDEARGHRLTLRFAGDSPGAEASAETPGRADDAALAGRRLLEAVVIGRVEEEDGGKGAEIEARRYVADPADETGRRLEGLLYATASRFTVAADRQTVDAPGAGWMLVESRPAGAPGAGADAGPVNADAAGTTRLQWNGGLTLDRATGRADVREKVRVQRLPAGANTTAELECENATAWFAAEGGGPAGLAAGRLLRVLASGAVYATQGEKQLVADEIEYDALASLATLRAAPGNVVTIFDEARGVPLTATEVEWDLARDAVRATGAGPVRVPR